MIVLDTCALLWLVSDQKKLSRIARKTIEKNANGLFISAITAFEIAVKCRSGKLELPLPPSEWIPKALEFHGIAEIPLTIAIAVASVQLPLLHNDPCDRIIIATARENRMKIITCDDRIAEYGHTDVVW
jgi:PIN domain nuclease of toxin-antitoxin system